MKGEFTDYMLQKSLVSFPKLLLDPLVNVLVKYLARAQISQLSQTPSLPISNHPEDLIRFIVLHHPPGDIQSVWPVLIKNPLNSI